MTKTTSFLHHWSSPCTCAEVHRVHGAADKQRHRFEHMMKRFSQALPPPITSCHHHRSTPLHSAPRAPLILKMHALAAPQGTPDKSTLQTAYIMSAWETCVPCAVSHSGRHLSRTGSGAGAPGATAICSSRGVFRLVSQPCLETARVQFTAGTTSQPPHPLRLSWQHLDNTTSNWVNVLNKTKKKKTCIPAGAGEAGKSHKLETLGRRSTLIKMLPVSARRRRFFARGYKLDRGTCLGLCAVPDTFSSNNNPSLGNLK